MKNSFLILAALPMFACSNSTNTAETKTDSVSTSIKADSVQTTETNDEDSTEQNNVTPPDAVLKAFAVKFPKAEKVKWGMEDKTEYEAEFILNGIEESANFNAAGNWIETECEIDINALPKGVSDAVAKIYAGWTITEANKVETAGNGTIYETDIKKDGKKTEVAFKADGTEVKE